eukprot:1945304-Rhodomonas_salina.2
MENKLATLLEERGEDEDALCHDRCYDLALWQGRHNPAVLVDNDDVKGEWSAVFRDPSLMWLVLKAVPEGAMTMLHKVSNWCVTTRQERLASIEALKGGNAIAAYLRCKH